MKSCMTSLWLLTLIVQLCTTSSSLTSGSTTQLSLDQSAHFGETIFSSQKGIYTTSPITIKSTQEISPVQTGQDKAFSTGINSLSDLSSMSESNSSQNITIGDSRIKTTVTMSYSENLALDGSKTIETSIQPSTTTKFDSVMESGSTFTESMKSSTPDPVENSISDTLTTSFIIQPESTTNYILPSFSVVLSETVTADISLSSGLQFVISSSEPQLNSVKLETSFSSVLDSSSSITLNSTPEKLTESLNTVQEKTSNIIITSTTIKQSVVSNTDGLTVGIKTSAFTRGGISTSSTVEETPQVPFSTTSLSAESVATVSFGTVNNSTMDSVQPYFTLLSTDNLTTSLPKPPAVKSVFASSNAQESNDSTDIFIKSASLISTVVSGLFSEPYSKSVISKSRSASSVFINEITDLSDTLVSVTLSSAMLSVYTEKETLQPSTILSGRTMELFSTTSFKHSVTPDISTVVESTEMHISNGVFSTQIKPTPVSKSVYVPSSAVISNQLSNLTANSLETLRTVYSKHTSSVKIESSGDSATSLLLPPYGLTTSEPFGKSLTISSISDNMEMQESLATQNSSGIIIHVPSPTLTRNSGMLTHESSITPLRSTGMSVHESLPTPSRSTDVVMHKSSLSPSKSTGMIMQESSLTPASSTGTIMQETLFTPTRSTGLVMHTSAPTRSQSTSMVMQESSFTTSRGTGTVTQVSSLTPSTDTGMIIEGSSLSQSKGTDIVTHESLLTPQSSTGFTKHESPMSPSRSSGNLMHESSHTLLRSTGIQMHESSLTQSRNSKIIFQESSLTPSESTSMKLTEYSPASTRNSGITLQESSLFPSFGTKHSLDLSELLSHVSKTDITVSLSTKDSVTLLASLMHSLIPSFSSEHYQKNTLEYESLSSAKVLHFNTTDNIITTSTLFQHLNISPSSHLSAPITSDQHVTLPLNSGYSDSSGVFSTFSVIPGTLSFISQISVTSLSSAKTVTIKESIANSAHSVSYLSSLLSLPITSFTQISDYLASFSSTAVKNGPGTLFTYSVHATDTPTLTQYVTMEVETNVVSKPISNSDSLKSSGISSFSEDTQVRLTLITATPTFTSYIPSESEINALSKTASIAETRISRDLVSPSRDTQISLSQASISTLLEVSQPTSVSLDSSFILSTEAVESTNDLSTLDSLNFESFIFSSSSIHSLHGSKHTLFSPTEASGSNINSSLMLYTKDVINISTTIDMRKSFSYQTSVENIESTSLQVESLSSSRYVQTFRSIYPEPSFESDTRSVKDYGSDGTTSHFTLSYSLTSDIQSGPFISASNALSASFSNMSDVFHISETSLFSSQFEYNLISSSLTGSSGIITNLVSVTASSQNSDVTYLPTFVSKSISLYLTESPRFYSSLSPSSDDIFSQETYFLTLSQSLFTTFKGSQMFTLPSSFSRDVSSQISPLLSSMHTGSISYLSGKSAEMTPATSIQRVLTSQGIPEQTSSSVFLSVSTSMSDSLRSSMESTVATENLFDSETLLFSSSDLYRLLSTLTNVKSSLQSDTRYGLSSLSLLNIKTLITTASLSSSLIPVDMSVTSITSSRDTDFRTSTNSNSNVPDTIIASVTSDFFPPPSHKSTATQSISLHTAAFSKSDFVTSTGKHSTTSETSTESFTILTISLDSSHVRVATTSDSPSSLDISTTISRSKLLESQTKQVSFFTESLMSSLDAFSSTSISTSRSSGTESTVLILKPTLSQETIFTTQPRSSVLSDIVSYPIWSSNSSSQFTSIVTQHVNSDTLSAKTSFREFTEVLTSSYYTNLETSTGSELTISTLSTNALSVDTLIPKSSTESSFSLKSETVLYTSANKATVDGVTFASPFSNLVITPSSNDAFYSPGVSSSVSSKTSEYSPTSFFHSTFAQVSLKTYSSDRSKIETKLTETSHSKVSADTVSSSLYLSLGSLPVITNSKFSAVSATSTDPDFKVTHTSFVTGTVLDRHSSDLFTLSDTRSVSSHYPQSLESSSSLSFTHLLLTSLSTESEVLSKSTVSLPFSIFHQSSSMIEVSIPNSLSFTKSQTLSYLISDVKSSTLQIVDNSTTTTSTIVHQTVSSSFEGSTLTETQVTTVDQSESSSLIESIITPTPATTIYRIVSSSSLVSIETSTPVSTLQNVSSVLTEQLLSTIQSSSPSKDKSIMFESSDITLSSSSVYSASSDRELFTISPTSASDVFSSVSASKHTERLSVTTQALSTPVLTLYPSMTTVSVNMSGIDSLTELVSSSTSLGSTIYTSKTPVSANISGTDILTGLAPASASVELTMYTSLTVGTTNISGIDLSTESISPSLSLSSLTTGLSNITSSVASVSRSVPIMTSSIISTTATPSTTTAPNGTNAKEANWVRTVLKIQRSKNISDRDFVLEMEKSFADAFNEAFIRQKLIQEGRFEPLQRRRRRKRYTSVGDASVHMHELSRVEDTTTVAAIYTVEKSGNVLTAEEAVAALDVLNTQELAIILKQVVDVKAEPYIQTEKPDVSEDSASKLWLIGVIAGSVAGGIIVIWIIVCVYCKCCRHKETEEDAEPELTSIHPQGSKRKVSQGRPLPSSPPKKTIVSQGSKFSLKKGRTYEINDAYVPETETEGQVLLKSPVKKKHQSPKSSLNGSATVSPVLPKKELVPPAVKKGRRNSRNSIGPLSGDFVLTNDALRTNTPNADRSQLFQSIMSEDSDDTKKQLKIEKKKNKDRLSELYGKEFEPATRSKDSLESKILGMPNTSVPSFVIESGSPAKVQQPSFRRHSFQGSQTSGDENLEEARSRMHKLLDDAFSLISPRASFTENDIRKSMGTTSTSSLGGKPQDTTKSTMSAVDIDKAKDTIRGFTNPAYTSSYSEFLETWSPYRASDQVALISMPHKPEPSVTKLGNRSDKRPSVSKTSPLSGRRPAAHLDQIGSKSINDIQDTPKYTTKSPKPIVLRTKYDTPNGRLDSARSNKDYNGMKNNRTISATGFNGDVLIGGSGTSLTKSGVHVKPEAKDFIEMQNVNGSRRNSVRKHRVPEKDNRNRDEVDVIQSIKPEEATESLLKSLRDELKSSKIETEEDINKKPIRRRNRKAHSKPMTDIV